MLNLGDGTKRTIQRNFRVSDVKHDLISVLQQVLVTLAYQLPIHESAVAAERKFTQSRTRSGYGGGFLLETLEDIHLSDRCIFGDGARFRVRW